MSNVMGSDKLDYFWEMHIPHGSNVRRHLHMAYMIVLGGFL